MKILQLKNLFLAVLFGLTAMVTAQSDNVFLERSYWKTAPTKADVDAKIAEGNDASAKNRGGYDGVTYAILETAPHETITYMVSLEGNDVNKKTHDDRNYIFWAAYKNNLPLMKVLMDKGSSLDIVDTHGNSPLTYAATYGVMNTELYDFLIDNGADVNFTQEDGATALLLIAPYDQNFQMTKYFGEMGMDLNALDAEGNSAFNYAARGGNIEMMDYLIKNGVDYKTLNEVGGNAMFFAARGMRGEQNPLSVFVYLEEKEVWPNITDKSGNTPLHILARNSEDVKVFQFFIERGVDPNQMDSTGTNALMIAAESNSFRVVQLLGKYAKDINAKNKEGQTAFNNAIRGNTADVLRFLTTQGAKSNDLSGEALIASVQGNEFKDFQMKLKVLRAVGYEPSKAGKGGNTLLHFAAAKDNVPLLKILSSEGIDIDKKNEEGYTALIIAAMKSSDDAVLRYLFELGADTKLTTEFGETAFDLASENEMLTKNKTDLNFLK